MDLVRGAIVGHAQVNSDVEPGAPQRQGPGHPTAWDHAVIAVLVAAHLRKVAPAAPLELALSFLVHVARYREPQDYGVPTRAERERLRRHSKKSWVRRRVALLARAFDLPVSFD